MAKQVIDTDSITSAIIKLRAANQLLNAEFDAVKAAAQQLEDNWQSRAAEKALTLMYEITKGGDERSAAFERYIQMLDQQVNPGYIDTEGLNISLADQFK